MLEGISGLIPQTIAGTPYWMSPEVIRGERYGTAADVYSFAIILWQILTEKPNIARFDKPIVRIQSLLNFQYFLFIRNIRFGIVGGRECIDLMHQELLLKGIFHFLAFQDLVSDFDSWLDEP